ncbi:MAG: hypothetical protein ACKO5J_12565 [Rubrivivax sp.]
MTATKKTPPPAGAPAAADTPLDWNTLSPLAMWRDWVARSESQWSATVSQLLKDPRAGGALNRQLDELRMAHRLFGEMAQASLAASNLPSRSDLEALDERLGRVEDGLAGVAAELARLRTALESAVPAAAVAPARPARDRRPAGPAVAAPAAPTPPAAAPRRTASRKA